MKDYKKIAALFNVKRAENPTRIFTSKEMRALFNEVGLGKDLALVNLLSNKGVILYVGRNEYMLPKKPVYFKYLENVIKEFNTQRTKKYRETKVIKKEAYENMILQKSIDIVKAHGYLVIQGTVV
jgi:hypothetical protein